jgi:hypothetical protein
MKRISFAAGAAAISAICIAAATPAAAAPPIIEHFDEHQEVLFVAGADPEFCPDLSFDVLWVEDAEGTFRFVRHGDGDYHGGVSAQVVGSYTNPENGLTFSYTRSISDRDVHVTDNGDGTVTLEAVSAGISKYYDDAGERLFIDAGRLGYSIIIDTGGTPEDPDDDEFVAFLGDELSGRFDTAERDFCTDLEEFLG